MEDMQWTQYAMTNAELQEAITTANEMAKSVEPCSQIFEELKRHLVALLKVQQMRAEMLCVPN